MALVPSFDLTASLIPFAAVAISMIGVTIFVLTRLIERDGRPTPLTSMTLGVAALGGGSVLLLALLFVFLDPDGTTAWTWVLLAFNFMMMGPAGLWFVSLIVFKDRPADPTSWLWPVILSLVIVGSEVFMGVLFAVGGGNAPATFVGALAQGLGSIWFDWSMGVVMLSLWLWLPISGLVRGSLAALTAAAFLAPWVTAAPLVGVVAMAVVMGGAFGWVYRRISRSDGLRPADLGAALGLAAAFACMVVAQVAVVAAPGSDGAALAFGGTTALVMGVEVAFVVRRSWDSYTTDINRIQVARPTGAV